MNIVNSHIGLYSENQLLRQFGNFNDTKTPFIAAYEVTNGNRRTFTLKTIVN